MAIGIKTISNDMRGAPKAPQGHHHAHQQTKQTHDSKGTNKILELEWEALGKKLNKPMGKESTDVEKLRQQLKDKEEQLKYAESVIAQLKRQLQALQQNKPAHNPAHNQPHNQGQQFRQAPKKSQQKPQQDQQRFQRPAQKPSQKQSQRPSQGRPQERARK